MLWQWIFDRSLIASRLSGGYSGSPLVHGDLVYVHAAGKEDKGLLAFETDTGKLRWSAAVDEQSYSSPHLIKLFDREFVGMMTSAGLTLFEPGSGRWHWIMGSKVLVIVHCSPQWLIVTRS